MPRRTLGTFELTVLRTLIQQPEDAYGVTLLDRISERTGHDASIGALYTTLDRMERKGLVSSWWGEATAERGGRRKRFYRIETAGREAVHQTEEHLRHLLGADGAFAGA
ncbi:PadR family transcriptional regulator [Acidiphilium sp. C61]|jgi:DNA-binding PadR family transcriptional regulator|uniref:PadR family transcriptional regulator n=1 Tax=Acidiphilium sp. C61 TaxID=1671485 RepID=UPI00157A99BA